MHIRLVCAFPAWDIGWWGTVVTNADRYYVIFASHQTPLCGICLSDVYTDEECFSVIPAGNKTPVFSRLIMCYMCFVLLRQDARRRSVHVFSRVVHSETRAFASRLLHLAACFRSQTHVMTSHQHEHCHSLLASDYVTSPSLSVELSI